MVSFNFTEKPHLKEMCIRHIDSSTAFKVEERKGKIRMQYTLQIRSIWLSVLT